MAHFNLVSQLAPPTENIHIIKDDRANSEIGYSHGTIAQTGIICKKILF